jgi:hypothetical protein
VNTPLRCQGRHPALLSVFLGVLLVPIGCKDHKNRTTSGLPEKPVISLRVDVTDLCHDFLVISRRISSASGSLFLFNAGRYRLSITPTPHGDKTVSLIGTLFNSKDPGSKINLPPITVAENRSTSQDVQGMRFTFLTRVEKNGGTEAKSDDPKELPPGKYARLEKDGASLNSMGAFVFNPGGEFTQEGWSDVRGPTVDSGRYCLRGDRVDLHYDDSSLGTLSFRYGVKDGIPTLRDDRSVYQKAGPVIPSNIWQIRVVPITR